MPIPMEVARAAVLTGVLGSAEVAPTPFAYRRKPAIVETLPGRATPLDLDAREFRYLVIEESFVIPLRDVATARVCRDVHRRR
ncbi:MAG: hypothetical protein ACYC7A_12720 [Thermoanaerobaculia bacterium]